MGTTITVLISHFVVHVEPKFQGITNWLVLYIVYTLLYYNIHQYTIFNFHTTILHRPQLCPTCVYLCNTIILCSFLFQMSRRHGGKQLFHACSQSQNQLHLQPRSVVMADGPWSMMAPEVRECLLTGPKTTEEMKKHGASKLCTVMLQCC